MTLLKAAKDAFRRGAREAFWKHPLIRKVQAEAWDKGYTSGHSRAMRLMSDEPGVTPGVNPYRESISQ